MARRKLVAGNWKMNGSRTMLRELGPIADAAAAHPHVDVALAVPFTLITAAAAAAPGFWIGAQDVHEAESGAHTGCVSAAMIAEAGARFSIVGHSERRADQGESDAHVRGKAEAARGAGLDVILCVGETLEDRDAGRAEAVVTAQLAASLPQGAGGEWLAVAYEPIWAIGTGKVPSVDDIAAMHAALRARLVESFGADGSGVRILYGGSVNAKNVGEIVAQPDVDGALVGGASLDGEQFATLSAIAAGGPLP